MRHRLLMAALTIALAAFSAATVAAIVPSSAAVWLAACAGVAAGLLVWATGRAILRGQTAATSSLLRAAQVPQQLPGAKGLSDRELELQTALLAMLASDPQSLRRIMDSGRTREQLAATLESLSHDFLQDVQCLAIVGQGAVEMSGRAHLLSRSELRVTAAVILTTSLRRTPTVLQFGATPSVLAWAPGLLVRRPETRLTVIDDDATQCRQLSEGLSVVGNPAVEVWQMPWRPSAPGTHWFEGDGLRDHPAADLIILEPKESWSAALLSGLPQSLLQPETRVIVDAHNPEVRAAALVWADERELRVDEVVRGILVIS